MKLSIIIPCYNEENNLELLLKTINNDFKKIKNYELIFINDGSRDNTYNKLKKLSNQYNENIKIINFSRNFGKEAAMYAGLEASIGDYVAIIDADMQQDPKLILDMLNILEKDSFYDSVAAYQKERHESKLLVYFKNKFYNLINKLSDTEFVQGASDFRLFRRQMVDSILSLKEYYRFSKGIFSWVGYNTYYLPYEVNKRYSGQSSWSFWKLFKYAVEGIVAFSTVPLRFATITGLLSSFISFVYLIVVIIQKLVFEIAVPGYATIVVLILLLGGMQLFALGLLGEYLARVYVETKKRPIYIAKEIITKKKNKN